MALQQLKSKEDDPKDLVSARFLKLRLVREQLEMRGLEVLELSQIWRHVHGEVLERGDRRFLKLASTWGISRATRNEAKWNRHLFQYLPRDACFSVPEIYLEGRIDKKFFYLAEFVDAKPLSPNVASSSHRLLRRHISQLAQSAFYISRLPLRTFTWDRAYSRLKNPGRRFYNRALGFFRSVNSLEELVPLLEKAELIRSVYEPALAHGDFTPWHMLRARSGDLYLTDAEWACSCLPKYYDVAYCYHRIGTMLGRLDLASRFLQEFRDCLSSKARRTFERDFRPILAERTIGGYWDCLKGENPAGGKLKWHRKLKEIVLSGEF